MLCRFIPVRERYSDTPKFGVSSVDILYFVPFLLPINILLCYSFCLFVRLPEPSTWSFYTFIRSFLCLSVLQYVRQYIHPPYRQTARLPTRPTSPLVRSPTRPLAGLSAH